MAKVYIKTLGKTCTPFDETQIIRRVGVWGVDVDAGKSWGSSVECKSSRSCSSVHNRPAHGHSTAPVIHLMLCHLSTHDRGRYSMDDVVQYPSRRGG